MAIAGDVNWGQEARRRPSFHFDSKECTALLDSTTTSQHDHILCTTTSQYRILLAPVSQDASLAAILCRTCTAAEALQVSRSYIICTTAGTL